MTIMMLVAVTPGLFFLYYIYKLDKIESEPKNLVVRLLILGALSTLYAVVLEMAGSGILGMVLPENSLLFLLIENFIVIACAEESGKYLVMKKTTWNHPSFDYRFDAVVYAAAVGLGFAILENIEYVFSFGLQTGYVRAVTAIPAHTIFAIYMGHYYGEAKLCADRGDKKGEKANKRKAFLVPVVLHGTYDFLASGGSAFSGIAFIVFVIVVDILTYKRVRKYAREDRMV